jgi:N-acetylmuramoyl-L-alanine amidase
MSIHRLALIATLGIALAAPPIGAAAAPTVRTMYNDAFAREQSVRAALAAADAPAATLDDVRRAIARYEAVVRRYPASSYSDNALWQAAHLALDAFTKFGEAQDKEAAVRLLQRLRSMYPTSRLAAQVPDQLAAIGAAPPAPAATSGEANTVARTELPPGPPRSTDRSGIATIRDIKRAVLADAVRIVIELDGEVSFRQDRIENPTRVFVDLPGTKAAPLLFDQTLRFEGDADVVRQIRIGRHPNNTTRVVLDATGVSSYSIYPLYEPYRLVIDCVRGTPEAPTAGVMVRPDPAPPKPPAQIIKREPVPLYSRASAPSWLRSAPGNVPQHGVALAEAHAPLPELPAPTPVAPPMRKPAEMPAPPAARNSNGNFSIARQLGLSVSRIVIDPGHGGHDPGAQARGVGEAELVLDVALRLEKLLQKVSGVEVLLTRRTDDFIALQERTAIANREGADLFLSIHANASTSAQARGVETYFLNFASNLSAAAVAARENAASGQAMGALPDIVKAIALNNKLDESREFAAQVQHSMLEHLRAPSRTVKDLGVKQAPFVVLIGAAMPSVLAEISFVTNPQEARLLKGNAYRQKIAEALFEGIRKYQETLNKNLSLASQQ